MFCKPGPPPSSILRSTDSCSAQQAPEAEHNAPSDVCFSGVRRARFLVFASAPSPLEHLWQSWISRPVMRHTVWWESCITTWASLQRQPHTVCLHLSMWQKKLSISPVQRSCRWLLGLMSPCYRKCRCTCQWHCPCSKCSCQVTRNSVTYLSPQLYSKLCSIWTIIQIEKSM